jgi:site-specific recombinase XerD
MQQENHWQAKRRLVAVSSKRPSVMMKREDYYRSWTATLYSRNKNGKTLGYHGARLVVKRTLRATGLEHGGLASHLFRWGFATQMNASGVPANTLHTLLHHQQIAQPSEYIRLNNESPMRQYKQSWRGQLTLTPG